MRFHIYNLRVIIHTYDLRGFGHWMKLRQPIPISHRTDFCKQSMASVSVHCYMPRHEVRKLHGTVHRYMLCDKDKMPLTSYMMNMSSFQCGGSSSRAPAAGRGTGRNPGCGVTQPWQPLQQSSSRFKGNCLSLEGRCSTVLTTSRPINTNRPLNTFLSTLDRNLSMEVTYARR